MMFKAPRDSLRVPMWVVVAACLAAFVAGAGGVYALARYALRPCHIISIEVTPKDLVLVRGQEKEVTAVERDSCGGTRFSHGHLIVGTDGKPRFMPQDARGL
jgi:hypothetical protein